VFTRQSLSAEWMSLWPLAALAAHSSTAACWPVDSMLTWQASVALLNIVLRCHAVHPCPQNRTLQSRRPVDDGKHIKNIADVIDDSATLTVKYCDMPAPPAQRKLHWLNITMGTHYTGLTSFRECCACPCEIHAQLTCSIRYIYTTLITRHLV